MSNNAGRPVFAARIARVSGLASAASHPQMPYRCRKCYKFFSVKTNSLMQQAAQEVFPGINFPGRSRAPSIDLLVRRQQEPQGFVGKHTADGATVYTDEHAGYRGLPNHQAVKHSVGGCLNEVEPAP